MASRSTASRSDALLCLKVRMAAPEARAPFTMEVWLRVSETIRSPRDTRAGMVVALVLKPMLRTRESYEERSDERKRLV